MIAGKNQKYPQPQGEKSIHQYFPNGNHMQQTQVAQQNI